MRKRLVRNSAYCSRCGFEVQSKTRHDMRHCKCGNVFVDGGLAYERHGWHEEEHYTNTSVWLDTTRTLGGDVGKDRVG